VFHRPINREIELLAPLTFIIVGHSHDHHVVSPAGTGFFVAPYMAVTARHVAEALWKELALPWHQSKYPWRSVNPDFAVRLYQTIDPRHPDTVARWEVTGCTRAAYTNVAFLNVVPDNELAEQFTWPAGFRPLQLTSPPLGAKVSAVGYPKSMPNFVPGKPGYSVDVALTVEDGVVVKRHDRGRGSWRFPQFETTACWPPGMSGAPVVHDGRVCGVVSYSTEYRHGYGESYAACLWPLLLQEIPANIDPRLNNLPLPDLLRQGVVEAPGWREIKQQAFIDRTENGHSIAAMRLIVAG
jgi:hypothetical protein